ncbi:hypothetical protein [Hymenobacter rigui]|uniref:Uncharacterized protein n=1 Tax=Hymenobacter rigui TaxID=334424 RepID=A0A3R9MSG6_9BACT|nr:hypothetical protein [Hymenobacter rigui]RSK48957.1 hypothetical protein EI291_10385 [Hymenobacter rigui]
MNLFRFGRSLLLGLLLLLSLAAGHAQQRVPPPTQAAGYSAPDWQLAFWVASPHTAELRAVRIYFGSPGFPNLPVRLHLYEASGPDQAPGEDILTDNVFICPTRWNGWYWFDVQTYQLQIPNRGFFVALEPILGSNNFTCFPSLPTYQPTGPLLSPEQPGAVCWIKTTHTAWQRLPNSASRPRYEQLVQLEVTYQ